MQGKRHDFEKEDWIPMDAGDYGRSEGVWYARPPQSDTFHCGPGSLANHDVVEHEDGTITVSPSILVTGHHGVQWHGYLERGIWREV
jgi:hypothetical protein